MIHEAREARHASTESIKKLIKEICRNATQQRKKRAHSDADRSRPELSRYGESETLPPICYQPDGSPPSKKRKTALTKEQQQGDTDSAQDGAANPSPDESRIVLPRKCREEQPKEEDQAVISHEATTKWAKEIEKAAERLADVWSDNAEMNNDQGLNANTMHQQIIEPVKAEEVDDSKTKYTSTQDNPDSESLPSTIGVENLESRRTFPEETQNSSISADATLIKLERLEEIGLEPTLPQDHFCALLDQEGDPISSQGQSDTVLNGTFNGRATSIADVDSAVEIRSFTSQLPTPTITPVPIENLLTTITPETSIFYLKDPAKLSSVVVQSKSSEHFMMVPPKTPQKATVARDPTYSSPLSSLGSTPDYSPPPASQHLTGSDNPNDEAYDSPSPLPLQRSPTKHSTPRRPTTKTKSHYFPKRANPVRLKCSVIPFPPLSSTSFGLFQERLHTTPFWLLIAAHFLNKTKGVAALPAFYDLMTAFPTPEALAAAEEQQILPFFARLGLQNRRSSAILSFARTWLLQKPEKGKRYRKLNYPSKGDGKDIALAEESISDDDPRVAWEVAHLPTVGAYALDSWRIFCRDALRNPASTNTISGPPILEDRWDGNAERQSGLSAEWTRVMPTDKELRAYLKWRWMRLGWDWDWNTGGRKELSNQKWVSSMDGGIVIEEGNCGTVKIREEECPMVMVESTERFI